MGAPKKAWRLDCNLARAGRIIPAGAVVDDLSADDLRDLGDLAVPVDDPAPSAGGANQGAKQPQPKRWTGAERATVCERIDEAAQGGVSDTAAIKALRQAGPELPAVSTLRKWLKAWRAAKAETPSD